MADFGGAAAFIGNPDLQPEKSRGWDAVRVNLSRPFSVRNTESSLRSPSYSTTVCTPLLLVMV